MRYPLDRVALLYRLACAEYRAERLQAERDDAERRAQEAEAAEKRAEQADARRRHAEACASAIRDLAEEWRQQSYRDRVRADHNAELAYTQRQAALRAEGVPEPTPPIWIGGNAA